MVAVLNHNEALLRDTYDQLSYYSVGLGNAESLVRMFASQVAGNGEMPDRLGLSAAAFERFIGWYFPGLPPQGVPRGGATPAGGREEERRELIALFLANAPRLTEDSEWMATILATGCMGGNHLWQDLGLWSRKDVSAFVTRNFPLLREKNDRDMKWKKFFYKQLCNQEGIYTCRAPSCEVCNDYPSCFGPEA